MITVDEARNITQRKVDQAVIDFVENKIKTAAECGQYGCNIDFDKVGHEGRDIAWIRDAGFKVTRNGCCLWWEISWED